MSVTATAVPEELRLLGIKSLAAAFGCHPKTLARRIADARIEVYKINRYDPAIRLSDVRHLLQTCREAA